MELLIGVIAGLIVLLVSALWPGNRWLCERCVQVAVRKLPDMHQEAKREEWNAELDAYPGGIWSLWWAIDLIRGASMVAIELKNREGGKSVEHADIEQRAIKTWQSSMNVPLNLTEEELEKWRSYED